MRNSRIIDPELKGLADINEIMRQFDQQAQARAVEYLSARYPQFEHERGITPPKWTAETPLIERFSSPGSQS